MREFNTNIEIAAPASRVWDLLSDLARWHEWTPSIEGITLLDEPPLGVGSTVRIRQPKLRPAVWEVTAWEPGRGFAWKSKLYGLSTVGGHWITPGPSNCCRVDLTLSFHGLMGGLAGWLNRRLIERYMDYEAKGLKERCDQPE